MSRTARLQGALRAALRRAPALGADARIAYLGDLKIAPASRGGLVLARLLRAARTWIADRATAACAVVMDGTTVAPDAYTGRIGLFRIFTAVGAHAVPRLRAHGHAARRRAGSIPQRGRALFDELGRPRQAGLRRARQRGAFVHGAALAGHRRRARVRAARRHRARQATDRAGRRRHAQRPLLAPGLRPPGCRARAARCRCANQCRRVGYSGLLAAVPASDGAALASRFPGRLLALGGATMYAHGVPQQAWIVSSADI